MTRLHGVVYPDPPPPPGGPVLNPAPDPSDERAMALRFIRSAFDPPLPDPFADWLIELHAALRDGGHADTLVDVPTVLLELGYTFQHAEPTEDGGTGMTLLEALRLFGRHDLIPPEAPTPFTAAPGHPHQGTTALAAALAAYGIRTTVNVHNVAGGCTVRLSDEQAQHLADLILPAEGSLKDELAQALGMLECLTEPPPSMAADGCWFDHHGYCQQHSSDTWEGKCVQPQAHEFLLRHNVRTQP